MAWLDCSHLKIEIINGKPYCDFCGLEFEMNNHSICECYIDFDGEQWICQKCGTKYPVEYLRGVGWPV